MLFSHLLFSSDIQCYVNEKSSTELGLPVSRMLSYYRDSVWWVSDLRDEKHDGSDGSISRKIEALEPDVFGQSVLVWRWETLRD